MKLDDDYFFSFLLGLKKMVMMMMHS